MALTSILSKPRVDGDAKAGLTTPLCSADRARPAAEGRCWQYRAQHRPASAPKECANPSTLRRSAKSQQRCLRRRACSERARHRLLPDPLPPVRQNAFDQLPLLDAREHFEAPAAARALLVEQRLLWSVARVPGGSMNGGARGRAARARAMASHPCDGLNRSRYAAQRRHRHREIARTDEIGAGKPSARRRAEPTMLPSASTSICPTPASLRSGLSARRRCRWFSGFTAHGTPRGEDRGFLAFSPINRGNSLPALPSIW